jgi:N-acetylneuraminate synthase
MRKICFINFGNKNMNKNRRVEIGERVVGDGHPAFIIAEIGINHNGSVELAKKMIAGAIAAGVDAVKFQKRTPELCVPPEQREIERDTPWGRITYMDYRYKVEFSKEQYSDIDKFCRDNNIMWTASCWDEESVDFIEDFDPPFYKAPSASLTDIKLLQKMESTGKPLMISTGMSSGEIIENSVAQLNMNKLLIAHSTSTYPCKLEELNLNCIVELKSQYPEIPIGYSGHEVGLAPSWASIVLGANFVERHLTIDRAMWGTDQAASVEIGGFIRLVSNIRDIERSLGDGVKRIFESEIPIMKKLRRVG